ncbi:MAG: SMC-Scp complex subunit ScpB [Acidimicrobiia bacterium]|nr:SMC-Scp complex subunit ScpB [Acidimicrobiia bacterium]
MPLDDADRAIEALVLVAEEPVEARLLAQLIELPVNEVERRCAELAARYEAEGRGFALARVAGGYRYQSHPDLAAYVERFVVGRHSGRLSPAALETLAIVAYKQPISRAQVAAIRGVDVDGVVRTLVQRGLVGEVARDGGPGQAVLYGTTRSFLEQLGLDSLDDLAPLGQHHPGADVLEALEAGLRAGEDPRRPARASAGPDPRPGTSPGAGTGPGPSASAGAEAASGPGEG